MSFIRRFVLPLFIVAVGVASASSARAHFPWLAVDTDGHAIYFFGEHIAERNYHMPEKLKGAKVTLVDQEGKAKPVEFKGVESEKFVGKRSTGKIGDGGSLNSTATYGIYAGTKLTYYTQHILGKESANWPTKPSADFNLQGLLKKEKDGVTVQVLWKGKPLPGVKVKLFCAEGHEEGAADTDSEGKVKFSAKEVEAGLNGILVGYIDKEAPGELDGKKYVSESHYLTLTFVE